MTHWGWYWKIKRKHTPKELCSDFFCFDSFQLFKKEKVGFDLFEQEMLGFSISLYHVKAYLIENYFLMKFVKGKFKGNKYKLVFEKQSCNYGGFRYFFHCPLCQKRMRKLYCYYGVVLCRKCLNLGYYSQSVTPSMRFLRMVGKIEAGLVKKGGSPYEKPKWMRRRTFEKITVRYFNYEDKQSKAMMKEFLEIFGGNYLG